MKILQIVGYKNSGKTTISKGIISYCSCKGIKVGSLKNHGHGGAPVSIESTDSEQHRKAGASVAGVLGENIYQLSSDNDWNIADMLVIYEHLNIEFLLMEGFKELSYPKLVLLRWQADQSLLASLDNVVGVIASGDLTIEKADYPTFNLGDSEIISEWVYHQFLGAN